MSNIPEHLSYNFRIMIQEMRDRGIDIRYIGNTDVIEADYKGHNEIIVNTDTRLIPYNYIYILADKFLTKKFLYDKGFVVPAGQDFDVDDHDVALFYALNELSFPVVVKPVTSNGGVNVFANIESREDFIIAFRELKEQGEKNILVEKHVPGDEYRFFTTVNDFRAVVRRTPPIVTGDGSSTIKQLVEAENYRRMNPRNTCLCPIWIKDMEAVRTITRAGYDLNSILPEGKVLQIRNHSNVGFGGECEDVTDIVHPSYYELASQVLSVFPGLCYAALDIISTDITNPVSKDNYALIEINFRGGFSLHTVPGKGQSRNVLKPIIDMLFPETKVIDR